MQPTRIILTNGSRFLRESLKRVIIKTPGLQLVRELDDFSNLGDVVRKTKAEWIIYTHLPGEALPIQVNHILISNPGVRVMSVNTEGGQVKVLWTGRMERTFEDLTLEELISCLREKDWQANNLTHRQEA